jgi:hypothetical protein
MDITPHPAIADRIPRKISKGHFASLPYPSFSAFREAVLETYTHYFPDFPDKLSLDRHQFCGARKAGHARNLFYNAYTDGPELPTGDAFWLDALEDPREIFQHTHGGKADTYFDFALSRALETGEPGWLLAGLELHTRHRYTGRLLYRLRPPHKFFLLFSLPKHGLILNDHSAFELSVMRAYACGRSDLARCFFRKSFGLSELDWTATVNLCIAIMYPDMAWKEQAEKEAEALLRRSKSKTVHAHVNFFIGILEQNAKLLAESLATLARANPLLWGGGLPIDKIFNSCYHGLCSFAAVHAPELLDQIRIPDAQGWWPELFEATRCPSAPRPQADLPFCLGGELAFIDAFAETIDSDLPLYARECSRP